MIKYKCIPLSDLEHRLFLSALSRYNKLCKNDEDWISLRRKIYPSYDGIINPFIISTQEKEMLRSCLELEEIICEETMQEEGTKDGVDLNEIWYNVCRKFKEAEYEEDKDKDGD